MTSTDGRILIVDKDEGVAQAMASVLESQGISCVTVHGGEQALQAVRASHFDVALVDAKLPDLGGAQLLQMLRESAPDMLLIATSGYSTIRDGVASMQAGATDYLPKPVRSEELILVVKRAYETIGERGQEPSEDDVGFAGIVGRSAPMRSVFETIRKVAASRSNVLIVGESGTGKELVARAIHRESRQRAFPFISVHCSAIPTDLLESELFGHEKGAFTGAIRSQKGKFELADRGTLLLDEIGTLDQRAQVDLLRVLQEREFTRIGGSEVIRTEARVIATTNEPLRDLVRVGRFREDLYYRLNVVRIELPPLRERVDDIKLLVDHFLAKHGPSVDPPVVSVSPEALRVLCDSPWEGNIRELEHAIESGVVMSGGRELGVGDLPSELLEARSLSAAACLKQAASDGGSDENLCLTDRVGELEKRLILTALERCGQRRTQAAKLLGINERTLRYKLHKHEIDNPRSGETGLIAPGVGE